ncbi:uncharacterized protein LOC134221689 [Armigeres subalbatus]|uniref:uncharacterized protein LOC134221689 n=1 Tax=Armigeres subalbatus TaxID=124917 RepID=UPI002ED35ACB
MTLDYHNLTAYDGAWKVLAIDSLIASNTHLSDVDKFSYLLSSLSKEAKRVVEVIEVTSDNYAVAWELLEKRFENKYLIVKSYVEALFTADPVKKECHESLNRLIDTFERNLKKLEKTGERTANWSTLLVFMLSSRLDPATLRHWETHRKSTLVPSYTDLVNFLRNHSLVLQSLDASKGRPTDSSRSSTHRYPSHPTKLNIAHATVTPQKSCPFCNQLAHSPYQCEVFRKMTPVQRKGTTQCCIKDPSSQITIRFHPPKLTDPQTSFSYTHTNRQQSASLQPESQPPAFAVPAPQTSHFSIPVSEAEHIVPATVLLSTALVKVFSSSGFSLWARALLDSGSQLNFVSENIVQKLKLRRIKEFVPISGVGLSSTSSKHTTIIRIQSHCADFEDNWKFHVLPKLTLELPNQAVDICRSRWPSDVVLADPTFDQPGTIDLILGVDIFYDLLRDGQIKHGGGDPVLQNTALGWVVSGKVQAKIPSASVSNFAHVAPSPTIEDQLSWFWEIESCRTFGSSKDIADRRFYSLERRLNATPALKEAYTAFIHEYEQLGHMQPISDAETHTLPSYYLPHHCIVRPDSITTKLRVVFDASCSSDSGVSLNDALLVGPVIQDDLLSIVMRFRMPQFAIIADIEKMYRQIRVRKCDHPLQRIRWRDSATQPLQTFQLTTVTYGTSSAPYLATKCLQKLAEDGPDNHPETAMVLGRDFYMDDMLTGTDSIEEVTKQIVLSDIAHLFDPLGLAGPVLVQAKLFLQDLWRDGCDWKEPLNENRQHQWLELRDSFQHLTANRIPRWVVATTGVVSLEVHGFSDASERAYGACIYLRAVSSTGSIHVNLLTAKSKIAPNGKSKRAGIVSLPRLKLCGALLLSHLFEKVEFSLKLKAQNFFWTDSEITLYHLVKRDFRIRILLRCYLYSQSLTLENVCRKQVFRNPAYHGGWHVVACSWLGKPGRHNLPRNVSRTAAKLHRLVAWTRLVIATITLLAATGAADKPKLQSRRA